MTDNDVMSLPPKGGSPRLRLNTFENARRSFARVLRAFYDGKLDEAKYKATVYGLSQYLGYVRLGEEIKATKKLDEIRAILDEMEKEKSKCGAK